MFQVRVASLWGLVGGVCLAGAGVCAGQEVRTHEQVADALLAQMTLAEKVAQLNQIGAGEPGDPDAGKRTEQLAALLARARAGEAGTFLGGCGAAHTNAVQRAVVEGGRLKVPALFAHDVIHGYRTIFPTPLAESCAWDADLAERTAAVAAREARAAGVHWTFAPMVDVARDPRWGRVVEGAGEDWYLGSVLAAARVRGFQGPDFAHGRVVARDRVLACAKHFAAYGAAEGGRDYNTVDLSPITLRQVYLEPFRASVRAGVAGLMTAFNEINGVPCTGSGALLTDVLRGEWGFQGAVVSDYSSVTEMIAHGFVADRAAAARVALQAGCDIDMMSGSYLEHVPALVERGVMKVEDVDRAVKRVLVLKAQAGLFEQAMTNEAEEAGVLLHAEHRALAREAAGRSCVLLKNEAGALPLGAGMKRLAVIGALADSGRDALGTWACTGRGDEAVTPLAGLRAWAKGAGVEVEYASGGAAIGGAAVDRAAAAEAAARAGAVVVVLGEPEMLTGEGHSRASLELPAGQLELLRAVRASAGEKRVVVVLMIGRPLVLGEVAGLADAVVVAWHGGTEAGSGLADVLTGAVNPSGRLTMSFPRSTGQVPVYYNHKPTGRPNKAGERYTTGYVDERVDALYGFGYGLSYTGFAVDGARVDRAEVGAGEEVTLSVQVRNTGARAGAEVVQWYVADAVASRTRPVRQLVGFARCELAAGEVRTVSVRVPAERLGFLDHAGRTVLEPGEVRLHAATGTARSAEVVVMIRE